MWPNPAHIPARTPDDVDLAGRLLAGPPAAAVRSAARSTPGPSPTVTVASTIAVPADPVRRCDLVRLAQRYRTVPLGIAPVVSAQLIPEGLLVEQQVPADARPLDGPALADAGPAGILAVLARLAAALAALHGIGLAHGDVRSDRLLCTAAGEPLLVGWVPGASPADDVEGLSRWAVEVLPPGCVDATVVGLVVRGADPDPLQRPPMSRLAEAFGSAARRADGVPLPAGLASRPAVRRSVGAAAAGPRGDRPGEVRPTRSGRHAQPRRRAARSSRRPSRRWRHGPPPWGWARLATVGLAALALVMLAVGALG